MICYKNVYIELPGLCYYSFQTDFQYARTSNFVGALCFTKVLRPVDDVAFIEKNLHSLINSAEEMSAIKLSHMDLFSKLH